jgi:hypothetical protein
VVDQTELFSMFLSESLKFPELYLLIIKGFSHRRCSYFGFTTKSPAPEPDLPLILLRYLLNKARFELNISK